MPEPSVLQMANIHMVLFVIVLTGQTDVVTVISASQYRGKKTATTYDLVSTMRMKR